MKVDDRSKSIPRRMMTSQEFHGAAIDAVIDEFFMVDKLSVMGQRIKHFFEKLRVPRVS